jgi:uncharacterized protein
MDNMVEILYVIRRIIVVGLTLYIAASAILYFFQEQLIFFRQPVSDERLRYIGEMFPTAEGVMIKTHDDISLHGWLTHPGRTRPSPLLIYFGGNAEEVSWMLEQNDKLANWSILLVNYRGYGRSGGRPGERELLDDAILLYDQFSGREEIDAEKIAVMGRSLGTAMAVHLSASRKVAATVLVSPFGSIEDIARTSYPVFPVRYLLRHRFNVLPLAESIENPMLTIIGSDDRIIPKHHSYELFQAWKGSKEMVVIHNAGHNDISMTSIYWESLNRFLNDQIRNNYHLVNHPLK